MRQKGTRFSDEFLQRETEEYLKELALKARGAILTMTTLAGSGHPGGSMSSIDVYLSLYYFLNITGDINKEDRDFVVVSHGHTSPGVYSALGVLGYIDLDESIALFRKAGSPYEGHVERHINGVEWSTGNLGQGLSAGCGFALVSKIKKINNFVFVVMGDGEQQKGQLSEARRFAKKYELKNLFGIIDLNQLQISGKISDVMKQNIRENYLSDGWLVYECDGHDYKDLYNSIKKMIKNGGPAVLLANTVMGKGVSFMEHVKDYHGKALTREQYDKAMIELGLENKIDYYAELRSKKGEYHTSNLKSLYPSIKLPKSKVYDINTKIDNRSAFGEALLDIAKENNKSLYLPIAVFDCDLASSVKTDGFAKHFSENFFQSGIQEHNTATIAGAVSVEGILSVFADFGVFGIDEVYNQQRLNDINGTNLKVVCTHLGVDVGEDGKTHQAIDYIGLLRNLYNFHCIIPADANQTYKAILYSFSRPGNFFIGMGRSVTPIISKEDGTPFFGEGYEFEYGKADIISEGDDGVIFSYGVMLYRAIKIKEILSNKGINLMVVNVSCPKKLDDKVMEKANKIGKIIVYEDHNVNTGLGSIIADYCIEKGYNIKLLKLGIENYCYSGKPDDLFALIGLSPEDAAVRIARFLEEK
ncbi:MAG: transketolase [Proteobacteria bacterium]|nr:transketolase [Pseudomonadota bacterium]